MLAAKGGPWRSSKEPAYKGIDGAVAVALVDWLDQQETLLVLEDKLRHLKEAESRLRHIRSMSEVVLRALEQANNLWNEPWTSRAGGLAAEGRVPHLAGAVQEAERAIVELRNEASRLRGRRNCWCGGTFQMQVEYHMGPGGGPDVNEVQCDRCGVKMSFRGSEETFVGYPQRENGGPEQK